MPLLKRIQEARQQGFEDDEILSVLSQDQDLAPRIQKAIDGKFSSSEILGVLSEPQPIVTEVTEVNIPQPVLSDVSPDIPAPGAEESFAQQLKPAVRPTLQAVGSIGGGLLAAPGGPLAIAGGGALGYATGDEWADLLLGEQTGTLVEELAEAGGNILEGAKLEAMGLLGGRILTGIGTKLFKPLTKKLGAETLKRLQSAKELDVPVTIGEARSSAVLKKGENFFRKLLTGAGKFERFDQKRFTALINAREKLIKDISKGVKRKESLESLGVQIQKEVDTLLAGKVQAKGRVLNKLKNDVLEMFGSSESYEELGRITKEAVQGRQREFESVASSFFNGAKEALPQVGDDIVPTPNILKAIHKALQEETKALTVAGKGNTALLQSIQGDFIEGATSFNSLVRRRSDLNDIISRIESITGLPGQEQLVVAGKKSSRLFRGIKMALDKDLSEFAKVSGTQVDDLIQAGVDTSKQKFDFIKTPGIKKLINSDPGAVLDVILKPKQEFLAKLLKRELNEKGLRSVQQAATNKLLRLDIDDVFSGTALNAEIKKAGEGTVRSLLGDETFESLQDFAAQAIAHERVVARFQTTGVVPKGLGLSQIDLAGNRFFKTLVRSQKPQNLINLIYQPGNTKNIRRTYAVLRSMGKPEKIQDLKAAFLESLMEIDPKTGNFLPGDLVNKLKRLDSATLKAAFSPEELKGFTDIANVAKLIDPKVAGKEGSLEVIRFIVEPIGDPLSRMYLSRGGRNLLEKSIRQIAKATTAAQKNEILAKLFAFGITASNRAKTRRLQEQGKLNIPLQPTLSR